MAIKTLKDALSEWQDVDGAMHELANCLGLMDESVDFAKAKHVYWSANPVGDALHHCLEDLRKAEILEFRDEPGDFQYRWNRSFKGSWE